ncbi:MAG: UvrB/UvrC motif-containing protein [Puniceicoccales bacterium]|jgi:protein arginine kinase activator|nr:UvrB/UvrC motif-containing protein [Puniceicoccales bacterium]
MEKCQFCGKPATVHMTQVINNKTTVIRMCNECAAKHGLFDKEGLPFAMLSGLGEALFSGMKQSLSANGLICSKCGCTPMSFKETGRLGCPNCYKDLKLLIDGIIESSQKGTIHKGKYSKEGTLTATMDPTNSFTDTSIQKPIRKPSTEEKLNELQEMLDAAVKAEQYEEAARLRDEIKILKGSGGIS